MVKTKSKILIVDDESDIRELIAYNLVKEGYEVKEIGSGKLLLPAVIRWQPDLIILDVMMPNMDGITACKLLRSYPEYDNILVLFLTARGEEHIETEGFAAGADDYVVKPIKIQVLLSRLQAMLKRVKKNNNETAIINFHHIIIDKQQYAVIIGDKTITLPRKEFELLYLLASQKGKVFTRDEIMDKVWGNNVIVGDRTIDVHIRKLREKIGDNYFNTIKGVGYQFKA